MGHIVQAFIASRAALERIQQQFSKSQVVDLQQGLALLPLLNELYDAIPNEEDTDLVDKHFTFLTPKIVQLIIRHSEREPIGYFETEYFGGLGDQGAILGKDGKIIFGPEVGSGSINRMLALMSFESNGIQDEFDTIGLRRFRSNEAWITQPDFSRPLPPPSTFFSRFLSRIRGTRATK
jgi:hypothetical protein